MHDFDPRDFDSRDRDDRRPDLGRGGHTDPANARVPDRATRDPRDIAIRHVDLPRGPRREPVRVRDRDYAINGNQSRVLATVGAFRVVSSRDLEASFGRAGDPRSSDLRHLRESGLVQTAPLPGHRDRVVTLTEQGRELLETRRRPGEGAPSGVLRRCPEASRVGARCPGLSSLPGGRRPAHRTWRSPAARGPRLRAQARVPALPAGAESRPRRQRRTARPDAEEIALWAVEHNLPYFDEQVHFPDVRIEYQDIDGRSREEDVEVTTVHYRGAHAAAAARSGFSSYGGMSARVSARPWRRARDRAAVAIPRLAEEMLS